MSRKKGGCGCGCFGGIISFLLALIFLALVAVSAWEAFNHYTYPIKYEEYVAETSAELNVPESLIYAVIQTESGFDPEARSEVGARGLMQITEETFEWLQTKEDFGSPATTFADLDEPRVSIAYGTYFLQILLDEFDGDVPTALSAYHAGRGSVHSWLEQRKYSENGRTLDEIPKEDTAYYVQKVTRAMQVYEKRLADDANQNENVVRLRANFDKFVDAYVAPILDPLFDRLSSKLGGSNLKAMIF